MKLIRKLIFALAVVLVIVIVGKNAIAKAAISTGVRAMTGLNLRIDKMSVKLLGSSVGINGLRLHNPAGFSEKMMIDVPEIYVDYDPAALVAGRVHLEEVRLEIKEFLVIKNEKGALNINALKPVQEAEKTKGQPPAPKEPAQAKKPMSLKVDRMRLRVGRVVYKDYTQGPNPRVEEYAVNIDEQYQNITNPQALAGLIVARSLANTAIARLANFDFRALQGSLGENFEQATELIGSAADTARHFQTDATQQLEKSKESMTGAVNQLKKFLPSERQ